jgi:copper transport protein
MIRRVALAVLAAGLIAPATASGHATIVRTVPADTAVVKTVPRSVTLTWSEPVDLGAHAVRLLDGTGRELRVSAPRHHGATAVLALPGGLAHGTYVVAWRVVSADSHPVSGAFSFSIGAPSAVVFSPDQSVSATVRALDGIGRAVAFLGLALLLGAAVLGRSPRVGAVVLIAGSVVVLLLQGPYAGGGGLPFTLGTRLGHALVVRIVLAVAFVWLLPRSRAAAALCGVLLVFTWTLADHSRTGVQTGLAIPVASLHLLAMAVWLGGVLVLLAGERDAARFSRLALVCFPVLAVTGIYLAYRQSGALGALPGTVFGRLLLVKAAVVAGIAGLAWFSRRAVQRRASPRATVAGEAFLGVAVLGVTAALVNTAPARVAYVDPIDTTVAGPEGSRVQVKIDPAKQGRNVADVYLERRGGLVQVPELTARLLPRDGGSGPLNVAFGAAEPGHYVADGMTVPYPGRWTLRLQIRTSAIDESDIDLPITIR